MLLGSKPEFESLLSLISDQNICLNRF